MSRGELEPILRPSDVRPIDMYTDADGNQIVVFDEDDAARMVEAADRLSAIQMSRSLGLAPPVSALTEPERQPRRTKEVDESKRKIIPSFERVPVLNKWYIRKPLGYLAVSLAIYSGAQRAFDDESSYLDAVKSDFTVENVLDGPQVVWTGVTKVYEGYKWAKDLVT